MALLGGLHVLKSGGGGSWSRVSWINVWAYGGYLRDASWHWLGHGKVLAVHAMGVEVGVVDTSCGIA